MIAVALPAAAVDDERNNLTGGPTLSFINGAWIKEGLKMKSSFEEIVKEVYKAIAKEVDFENKVILNSLISFDFFAVCFNNICLLIIN